MTTRYFLVHHKTFDKLAFYFSSGGFNEPTGIELVAAFDAGLYNGFSLYIVTGGKTETDLKTFVDAKYENIAHNVITEINKERSSGILDFQSVAALKLKVDNYDPNDPDTYF